MKSYAIKSVGSGFSRNLLAEELRLKSRSNICMEIQAGFDEFGDKIQKQIAKLKEVFADLYSDKNDEIREFEKLFALIHKTSKYLPQSSKEDVKLTLKIKDDIAMMFVENKPSAEIFRYIKECSYFKTIGAHINTKVEKDFDPMLKEDFDRNIQALNSASNHPAKVSILRELNPVLSKYAEKRFNCYGLEIPALELAQAIRGLADIGLVSGTLSSESHKKVFVASFVDQITKSIFPYIEII